MAKRSKDKSDVWASLEHLIVHLFKMFDSSHRTFMVIPINGLIRCSRDHAYVHMFKRQISVWMALDAVVVAASDAATRQTTTLYLLSFIQIIKLTHKSIGVAKYFTGVTARYTCFVLSYRFFYSIPFHSSTLACYSQCEFQQKNVDLYTYTKAIESLCQFWMEWIYFIRNYKSDSKIHRID